MAALLLPVVALFLPDTSLFLPSMSIWRNFGRARVDRQIWDRKGVRLDCGYRLDLLVESRLLVEVKAVEKVLPLCEAQVLTYLKLTELPVALLVNFNVPILRQGIRRLTRKTPTSDAPR